MPGAGIAGMLDMMAFEKHDRGSIRLQGFDYSRPGAYYITICAYKHKCLFGKIINKKMVLNEYGNVVKTEWLKTPVIRPEIKLDEYIIMPDHMHGIVRIDCPMVVGARGRVPLQNGTQYQKWQHIQPKSIPSFVLGFKSSATKQINTIRKTPKLSVWQRNYYEHVIRDYIQLESIRKYIINNPAKWKKWTYL
ncbi:MAG: transposase [Candidatus Margulisiibacteriota bacterium]